MSRHTCELIPLLLLLVLVAGCAEPDTSDLEERLQAQEERIAELDEQLRNSEMIILELNRRVAPERRLPENALALLRDQRVGIWGTDEQAMHFRFLRNVEVDRVEALVDTFNTLYDGDFYPGLEYSGLDARTLTVRVRDSDQLANRMGSTGAHMYMGTATLTLTSHPGVDSVYFDFGEDFDPDMGSHAEPGVMTRLDVASMIEQGTLP